VIYGVLRLDLRIPSAKSLKDKRSILRKAIEKIRNAYHVSANEVGDHDLHGNAVLGVSLTGTDPVQVEKVIQQILRIIDENAEIEVYDSVILVDQLK
jgi:uncharacterized protein YlxP (DUF503 family)